jgi:hypothetical protein
VFRERLLQQQALEDDRTSSNLVFMPCSVAHCWYMKGGETQKSFLIECVLLLNAIGNIFGHFPQMRKLMTYFIDWNKLGTLKLLERSCR